MTLIEVGFEAPKSRIGDTPSEAYFYLARSMFPTDRYLTNQEWRALKEITTMLRSYFSNLGNNFPSDCLWQDFDQRPDVFQLFTDELEKGIAFQLGSVATEGEAAPLLLSA